MTSRTCSSAPAASGASTWCPSATTSARSPSPARPLCGSSCTGELARREGAGALVTGESLGQVASQTLDNIRATNDAVELPVLRPLIGSDKLEIIEAAQELGTFEISSMDAPDCCTLFMPRNPETHAKLEAVREAEAAFPVDEWVRALADAAEPHDYACPAYKPPKKRE